MKGTTWRSCTIIVSENERSCRGENLQKTRETVISRSLRKNSKIKLLGNVKSRFGNCEQKNCILSFISAYLEKVSIIDSLQRDSYIKDCLFLFHTQHFFFLKWKYLHFSTTTLVEQQQYLSLKEKHWSDLVETILFSLNSAELYIFFSCVCVYCLFTAKSTTTTIAQFSLLINEGWDLVGMF